MASVSIEQKKLEQLKQQLFGKSDPTPYKVSPTQLKESKAGSSVSVASLQSVNLKSDLVKIAILSISALSIQLSIFFAQQHGLLKIF